MFKFFSSLKNTLLNFLLFCKRKVFLLNHPESKDGHYFLKVLDRETKRLLGLADSIKDDMERSELSEEVKGKLRSASGKAILLASQKMQQFRGLCTKNINRVSY